MADFFTNIKLSFFFKNQILVATKINLKVLSELIVDKYYIIFILNSFKFNMEIICA